MKVEGLFGLARLIPYCLDHCVWRVRYLLAAETQSKPSQLLQLVLSSRVGRFVILMLTTRIVHFD